MVEGVVEVEEGVQETQAGFDLKVRAKVHLQRGATQTRTDQPLAPEQVLVAICGVALHSRRKI